MRYVTLKHLSLFLVFTALLCSCTNKIEKRSLVIDTKQFSKSVSVLNTFPADKKRCWGVDVSATDIATQPENLCRPKLGIAEGYKAEGEALEVIVPKGTERSIRIVASLVDLGAACPSVKDLNDYSNSYLIYETTMDLTESETSIDLIPTFPGTSNNIKDQLGLQTTDCTTTTGGVSISEVLPVYPINGANWNDYVQNTSPSLLPFHQSDSVCPATGNRYLSCLHGGEFKKVVLNGVDSCANLQASDVLGAFEWNCVDEGAFVVFYSAALKPSKSLSDLIDSSGWLNNKVIVSNTATGDLLETSLSAWWSNPVMALPDSSSVAQALATPSVVYFVNSAYSSKGYEITADKVAITTIGSGKIDTNMVDNCSASAGSFGSGTEECLIFANGRKFLWVEGQFNKIAGNEAHAVFFNNTMFSRVHNLLAMKFLRGLTLNFSDNNFVTNLHSSGVYNATFEGGVYLNESDYNTFRGLKVANHNRGLKVSGNSNNNAFVNVHASNNWDQGIFIDSTNNTFVQVLSHHNSSNGIFVGGVQNTVAFSSTIANTVHGFSVSLSGSSYGDLHSVVTAGNSSGIRLTSASDIRMSDVVATNNSYGIDSAGAFTNNNVIGYTLVGNNSTNNCYSSNYPAVNFSDATCAGLSGLQTGKSLNSAFLGNVTTDDAVNPDDINGSASYGGVNNWVMFENFFRGWGEDLANAITQPSARCQTGTCRIYDYILSNSDSVIYKNSFDGVSANPALGSGSCPAALSGNSAYTDQMANSNTFLLRAVEIVGDSTGDDDGLCESNERCIYTPNIGHYQGTGALDKISCNFVDGTVSNVKLFKHAINGQ